MRLIENIRNYFRKDAAADEPVQRVIYIAHRPVLFSGTSNIDVNNLDRHDANIALCFRIIPQALASLPIQVQYRQIVDGEEQWENDDDNEISAIFERPNPFHRPDEIITHIAQSSMSNGNTYLIAQRNTNEIWPIPPMQMELKLNANGQPAFYILDPSNKRIPYALEDVIHFRQYHFSDPFRGRSSLEPLLAQAQSLKYAIDFNSDYFKNGATSDIYLLNESFREMSPEEEDEFWKSYNSRHQGKGKRFRNAVLPQGLKPWQPTQNMKDAAFIEGTKLNRETEFGTLGVPPSVAGVYEYANYANALIQKQDFWTQTILPFAQIIERTFNHSYIMPRWGRDWRIILDPSKVPALREDSLKKAQTESIYVYSGIKTVNEIRQEMNLEPVDWGEEPPQVSAPIMPQDQNNQDGNGEDNGNNGNRGDGKAIFANTLARKAPASPLRYNRWKLHDRKLTILEKKYSNLIANYYRGQMSRVVSNIENITARGVLMSALGLEFKKWDRKDDMPPDMNSGIFNIRKENDELLKQTSPFLREAVRDAGQSALNENMISFSFNVKNPAVMDMINQFSRRSIRINDTTWDKLKAMIRDSYDQGQSLGQLTKQIKSTYKEWISGGTDVWHSAQTIARTEMGGVVNGGAVEAYDQAGIEEKEWLAVQDEATRDAHADADGQIISIRDVFDVGGEHLEFPGDPHGSAGNTINCRCTVAPVVK